MDDNPQDDASQNVVPGAGVPVTPVVPVADADGSQAEPNADDQTVVPGAGVPVTPVVPVAGEVPTEEEEKDGDDNQPV